MDSLFKTLLSASTQTIESFSLKLAQKFNLAQKDILDVWNENVPEKELKINNVSKVAKPVVEAVVSKNVCAHVFLKGAKEGQHCSSKPVADSIYCKTHKTQMEKKGNPKEKVQKPKAKKQGETEEKKSQFVDKTIVSKVDTQAEVIKKLKAPDAKITPIRKNQYGNYENMETRLVFNPISHKVIGKQLENGNVAQLTLTDLELCKQKNFSYEAPVNIENDKKEEKKECVKEEKKEPVKVEVKSEKKEEVKTVVKKEELKAVVKKEETAKDGKKEELKTAVSRLVAQESLDDNEEPEEEDEDEEVDETSV